MRKFFLLASFFVSIFTVAAQASDNKISAVIEKENSCKLMGDNLYNCTPFECDTSLSDRPSDKIHNKISGLNEAGDCVTEQSTVDGEKVICKYSGESRKFLSLRMKKYQTDLTNIPQSSELEEGILADIFHNECDVISKNADDKPVVNEDEETAISDDEEEEIIPAPETDESDEDKTPDNGDLLDSDE